MPARLHGLSVALLGRRDLPPQQPYDPRDATLRYQLLSALAGTLVEGQAAKADVALLLVHEFHTPVSKPGVAARSSSRIYELLERFGCESPEKLPLEQPIGPFEVPGGGRIPVEATFHVAKVRTTVSVP